MNRLGRLRTVVRQDICTEVANCLFASVLRKSDQSAPARISSLLDQRRLFGAHHAYTTHVYAQIPSFNGIPCEERTGFLAFEQQRHGRCFADACQQPQMQGKLPQILQNIDSKDTRISSRAMDEFILLWQPSVDQTWQHELWKQMVLASTNRALQAQAATPESSQDSSATESAPGTPERTLVKTRDVWKACTPLWVSVARKLLSSGPREGFETVMRMREFAKRMSCEATDSEALPQQVMQGAAQDLGELLKERCEAPWTILRRVQWDEGPQELLRFLVDSETVLEDKARALNPTDPRSWDGLRLRTTGNRRMYSLQHHAMPTQPLAFASIQLRDTAATRLSNILSKPSTFSVTSGGPLSSQKVPEAPEPHLAVFYSLCATQQGLKGLDVGRQLIYRTCQVLHNELPTVRTFLTMSPIPGFLPWLRRCVSAAVAAEASGHGSARSRYGPGAVPLELEPHRQPLLERLFFTERDRENGTTWPQVLLRELQDPVALMSPTGKADALQPLLTYLCTLYLLRMRNPSVSILIDNAKKFGPNSSMSSSSLTESSSVRVMDPVAHFHFGNGALLNTVYWRANDSKRSIHQSLGIMASFQYVPEHLEQASYEYAAHGKTNFHAKIHFMLQRFGGQG